MKTIPIDSTRPIIYFTKVNLPFGWLGNMAPYPIKYEGVWWKTTEALFQALRFPPECEIREEIRLKPSPMGAKMRAKRHKTRRMVEPLSKEDLENMRMCLRLKVEAHKKLQKWLLNTGDAILIEDTTKRPRKNDPWGMRLIGDYWVGENLLGTMWMELREQIASGYGLAPDRFRLVEWAGLPCGRGIPGLLRTSACHG